VVVEQVEVWGVQRLKDLHFIEKDAGYLQPLLATLF
jgi:hypothetical protein